MADLESGSTVGGFPILHEGNLNSVTRLGSVPDSMVTKTQADGTYSRVYYSTDGISPKGGDILIESGPTISIYASGWNQIFPSV